MNIAAAAVFLLPFTLTHVVLVFLVVFQQAHSLEFAEARRNNQSPIAIKEMFLKTLNSIFIPPSKFSSSSSALLKIGDVLKKSRTFTDTDVLSYSKLTHDSNPVHFDSEFARNYGYNDRIVHGMLIAALFPRIIASHFPGAIYVSQSLQFKLPVYIGEEIVAEVKALNLRVNKDRYLSKFSTKCYKNGDLCIDGEAVALLRTLVMDVEGERS